MAAQARDPAPRGAALPLDGRALRRPLLTEENLDDLVARAAFRTKAEVDHLVATLQPRTAPRDGVRKRAIPAELRRQVHERDGGCCTWVGEDGRRCESRFQLEIDHVTPPRFGGKATLDDLRLLCKPHNRRHAEQVYGPKHMAKFRRDTRMGEVTISGDSDRSYPSR